MIDSALNNPSEATLALKGNYQHVMDFQVRDYECDLQGIVNNAVYQNYLEHARHQFLLERDVDFVALSEQGINLVVMRIEIDYKFPLRAGSHFWLGSRMKKVSRLKFVFEQDIFLTGSVSSLENLPVINAVVTGTAMNDAGKPVRFDGFDFSN